jgi:putative iron-only hydrogenase system regulator
MEFPWGWFLLPHLSRGGNFSLWRYRNMETRVAVMSIIVESPDSVERLNGILHEYGEFIIGRMGIPYRKRKISIISIALDAPQNTISSLAGKIGSLAGVSVKTAYSGVINQD